MLAFYGIPNCTTCKKAEKQLNEWGLDYQYYNLKEETPSKESLRALIDQEGEDSRRLFNTSGQLYRELDLANKWADLSLEDKVNLLHQDGMLVKRPLIIGQDQYTIGSDINTWQNLAN